jgi:hypothetical protein
LILSAVKGRLLDPAVRVIQTGVGSAEQVSETTAVTGRSERPGGEHPLSPTVLVRESP